MKTPSARKLPSGSWFIRVQVDGASYSITKPTEKEAIAEALALKAGALASRNVSGKDKTVEAAIKDYIEERRNILSPSTIRGYNIIKNNRFQTVMKSRIGSISPERWQSLVNLEARKVSAKTLKNSWGFISSVIHSATGREISVRLPQVVPNERNFLDPEQIPVFIKALEGERVQIAALLALCSLRLSEILALQWEDIDLPSSLIYVNGATVPDENNKLVHKKETKNLTSRRAVPIIPPLQKALTAAQQDTGPVVTMSTSGIYKRVNAICESCGFPRMGVHGLRHSFASLVYHLQIPEKVAMQIGGWANSQTMHKIYTHVGKKDILKHADKFTAFFAEKEESEENSPDAAVGA